MKDLYCWHDSHQRLWRHNSRTLPGFEPAPITARPAFAVQQDAFHCTNPGHEGNWACDEEFTDALHPPGSGIHCCESVGHAGMHSGPNGPCWTSPVPVRLDIIHGPQAVLEAFLAC